MTTTTGCSAPRSSAPVFPSLKHPPRLWAGQTGPLGPGGRGRGSLGPSGGPYSPYTGWMRASSRGGSSAERPQREVRGGPWLDSPLLREVAGGRWCLLQPPQRVAVPRGTVAHYLPGEVSTRSGSFLASPPHVTDVPLLRTYNKTSNHGFLGLRFSFETSTQRCRKDASLACSVSVEQLRGALQPALPRYKCYALRLHCFAVRG